MFTSKVLTKIKYKYSELFRTVLVIHVVEM